MALERDLELLDDYIGNRLKGSERAAFEDKLKTDPELEQALQMQQQIVEGLRKARITELKVMLSSLPVPPVSAGFSTLGKFAIGAFSAAVVGTILYLGLSKKEPVVKPAEQPITSESQTKPAPVSEQPETTLTVVGKEKETSVLKKGPSKNNASTSQSISSKKPVINAFTPAETEEEISTGAEMESPLPASTTRVNNKNSIVAEIYADNKKYDFHYVLANNKLTLYGNFETDLYEIIEVFNNEKRTAFLFYKNNYYLLHDGDLNVKELVPIKDSVLLNKLDVYRSQ